MKLKIIPALSLFVGLIVVSQHSIAATVTDVFGDIDNFSGSLEDEAFRLDGFVNSVHFRMYTQQDGFLSELVIPSNAGEITNYELTLHLELFEDADFVTFVLDNVSIGGAANIAGRVPTTITVDILGNVVSPVFPFILRNSLELGLHSLGISIGGASDIVKIDYISASVSYDMVVPLPATVWLFGTALIGLVGFRKRRKAA